VLRLDGDSQITTRMTKDDLELMHSLDNIPAGDAIVLDVALQLEQLILLSPALILIASGLTIPLGTAMFAGFGFLSHWSSPWY
jgi:hypothetical protein